MSKYPRLTRLATTAAVAFAALTYGYLTGFNDGEHFGFRHGVNAVMAEIEKYVGR